MNRKNLFEIRLLLLLGFFQLGEIEYLYIFQKDVKIHWELDYFDLLFFWLFQLKRQCHMEENFVL